jgi:casein kinase II subunit beta
MKVLPVGLSDELRTSRVKVFCPKCEEVYIPKFKSLNIDGSYFGTSLPHVFIKTFKQAIVLPPKISFYEPAIFGFKIFGKKGSKYHAATGRVRNSKDDFFLSKENLPE